MARHFYRKGDKVQAYHLGKLHPGVVQQNMGNGPRVIVLIDGELIARQFAAGLVKPAEAPGFASPQHMLPEGEGTGK